MDNAKLEMLFSKERLDSYKDEAEHKANFYLIAKLTPKLGMLEIVTRNLVFDALKKNDRLDILESYNLAFSEINDSFVSNQTFGFWAKIINEARLHNKLLSLDNTDFRKYSKFNKKANFLNFQKVKISYDLAVKIRNRAFHFENLFKTHENKSPRISTRLGKTIVGIDPDKLECFLDDFLDSFESGLKDYVE